MSYIIKQMTAKMNDSSYLGSCLIRLMKNAWFAKSNKYTYFKAVISPEN